VETFAGVLVTIDGWVDNKADELIMVGEGAGKTRLLFLGNNYNPISITCLDALATDRRIEVIVGIYHPTNRGILPTLRKSWSQYGGGFVARRGVDLLLSWARIRLRNAHVALSGYRSMQELVLAHRLQRFEFRNINSEEASGRLRSLSPDIIAVAAFSQILKLPVITAASLACINVHPSLLPKHRGPNPFYWVLQNQESCTGVTVHHIGEGIDSGDIILQEKIPLESGMTEHSLRDRSSHVAARLLLEAVRLVRYGDIPRIKQDEAAATYDPLPPRGSSSL